MKYLLKKSNGRAFEVLLKIRSQGKKEKIHILFLVLTKETPHVTFLKRNSYIFIVHIKIQTFVDPINFSCTKRLWNRNHYFILF
jgi:hypothetical protein